MVQIGNIIQQEYQCRFLMRFPLGTPYPDIAEQTTALLKKLPPPAPWLEDKRKLLARLPEGRKPPPVPLFHLLLDVTGVGRAIADMFSRLSVRTIRVTVTASGRQMSQPERDEFNVPKRSLIGSFVVALQTHRFKAPKGMPEVSTLVKESLNFSFKIDTQTGQDTYGAWRTGTHDDLLFAVCMGTWFGETFPPPQPKPLNFKKSMPNSNVRTRTNV